MAPLPPNSTRRYFVDYSDGQANHTFVVRTLDVISSTEASEGIHSFLSAWSDASYLLTILGMRRCSAGSNVSVPVTWEGDATYGSGGMPLPLRPLQVSFLGRDDLGRRFRLFLFGCKVAVPDNFRYVRGTGTILDDAYDAMDAAVNIFLTISGHAPTFYNFADANYNNYWERAIRS